MEEQMKLMVDMIKERIKFNLQIIRKNEETIRSILSQPVSNERSKLLKVNFSINRKLLEENNDSLNIEIQLINFISKYREVLKHEKKNIQSSGILNSETPSFDSESFQNDNNQEQLEENDESNLLNLTLTGETPFNSSHPKFNDKEFFETLLDAYKQKENYEICSYLLKVKGKK